MTSTTLLLDNPPSISAAELHEILLTTHASGNVARLRFMDALPAAADTTRSVREGLRRIAREPQVRCVEVRIDSGHPDQSGPPDSVPNGDAAADALAALIQLGSPMAEARRLRDTAWARLLQTGESVQAIDADRLLREALRMG